MEKKKKKHQQGLELILLPCNYRLLGMLLRLVPMPTWPTESHAYKNVRFAEDTHLTSSTGKKGEVVSRKVSGFGGTAWSEKPNRLNCNVGRKKERKKREREK